MSLIKDYLIQILVIATILVVAYLFRDKIFGAFTGVFSGRSLEEFKTDLQTIEDTDVTTLAQDVWSTVVQAYATPETGGFISAEAYQEWKEANQGVRKFYIDSNGVAVPI